MNKLPNELENLIYEFYNPYKEIYNKLVWEFSGISTICDVHIIEQDDPYYFHWRKEYFDSIKLNRFRRNNQPQNRQPPRHEQPIPPPIAE